VVAIGAKFVLRVRGKHVFNPGNLGVVFALLALPGTWVSPGQWGDDFALVGWFVALGGVVVHRARRADVSLAFLGFHLGFLALRVLWLGQRFAVWTHQLQSGALLLFAFFMISDPMTIPNHTRGRVAHAALVAAITYVWQFVLYRPNGLLWALFLAAPAVPLLDLVWPAARYLLRLLRRKADTKLFNKASQVVLVRDGDRTVMTMANDFKGEPKEFAVVIPVPTFLKREQIHVGDKALVDHLDAYSAPRLVEYFDEDPCRSMTRGMRRWRRRGGRRRTAHAAQRRSA
jgi:hypothetical protein